MQELMLICLQFSLSNCVNQHGWRLKALGWSEECSHPEHSRQKTRFLYLLCINPGEEI